MLFYWYFLLRFNYYIGQKKTTLDSTQSRDHQTDLQILPETFLPDTDILITVRPQITFRQHNDIEEIFNAVTYVAKATYIIQTFPNSLTTVTTLQISAAPTLHQDR